MKRLIPARECVHRAQRLGWGDSTATINVNFTAVSNAEAPLAPNGFDFSNASVSLGVSCSSTNEIQINTSIVASKTVSLSIENVLLPSTGGQTTFDVVTYENSLLRDDKLAVLGFFFLPGSISVMSTTVLSFYREQPHMYPIESLFPARASDLARAELVVSFQLDVHAEYRLQVASEGPGARSLTPSDFFVVMCETVESMVETSVVAISLHALEATLMPSSDSTTVALEASAQYKISLWCTPGAGANSLRFDVRDTATLMSTNSGNGGITPGFQVLPIAESLRCCQRDPPPGTTTNLTISVEKGDAVVNELSLIGPPGYVFPDTCGSLCTAGQALTATNQKVAHIALEDGSSMSDFNSTVQIQVQVPVSTSSTTWFVEARGWVSGTKLATGVGESLRVSGGAHAGVLYRTELSQTFARSSSSSLPHLALLRGSCYRRLPRLCSVASL